MKIICLLSLLLPMAFNQIHDYSLPRFIKQPVSGELIFKEAFFKDQTKMFSLECEAEGEPKPTYRWTKNGKNFDYKSHPGKRFRMRENETGTLVFLRPKKEDEGQYQCFAENEHGIATSNSVTLKGIFIDKVETKEVMIQEVKEGSPIILKCDVPHAFPKVVVTWSKQNTNGSLRLLHDPRITVDPEGSLCFSNVTLGDAMKNGYFYACYFTVDVSVSNSHFSRYILGNRVQLIVTPNKVKRNQHFLKRQFVSKNVVALRNEKTEFFCIYGGTPMPQVNWTKDGQPLEFNNLTKLTNYGKSIEITRTDQKHEGLYCCHVTSGENYTKDCFKLDVEIAPYFLKEPNSTVVSNGHDVTFGCEADGIPEPKIEWIYNANPIAQAPENPKRTVLSKTIIIRNVSEDDIGNYGCNASNSRGYVFKDFYLDVKYTAPTVEDVQEATSFSVSPTSQETTNEAPKKEKS